MNLHAVVANVIGAVNPLQKIVIQKSNGSTVNSDGSRSPSYEPPVTTAGQVQELTTEDLRHLEALNIQGSTRKVYLNGVIHGIERAAGRGGDLITLQNGSVWLVTAVLERWDTGWCKAAITLQNGS